MSNTQRIFTLVLAIAFLVSSIGAIALVVMQNDKQQKDAEVQAAALQALQNQQSQQTNPQKQEANKLQETQLQNYSPASIAELKTEDTNPGTGVVVKKGDTVTAHYTGAVASTGVIFQSSYDTGSPIPFSLDGVIKGWSEGVPGMKEGGTRRIYIPAALAYGANPPANSGIPANADLVFDVTLVKVGQ